MESPPLVAQWPQFVDIGDLQWSTHDESPFPPTHSIYPTGKIPRQLWQSSSETSGSSTTSSSVTWSSLPSSSSSSSSPGSSYISSSSNVFTTSYPVASTSLSISVVIPPATNSLAASASPSPHSAAKVAPVCLGHGSDAWSSGLIATVALFSVVGLLLLLLFGIIRPRFRQVYGLREWFPQRELRPRPLSSSFWAFLFPHVPLVPPVPSDVSNAGSSAVADAKLFPSDEELSQRTIFTAFLICLGWSIVALGGALPIYLVSTPCLAHSANQATATGAYSVIQDLSLLRLLQLFEKNSGSTTTFFNSLRSRATAIVLSNHRIRTIVLTLLVILLGVVPALWGILHEFTTLVAYRRRWVEVRCEDNELGWLSAAKAPGFVGWGEKRLKEYLLKTGLSSTLDPSADSHNGGSSRRRQPSNEVEELEIDVKSLFSIGDTEQLALLIDERDDILENLEISETRYIAAFRILTPDPSIAELEPPPAPVPENEKLSNAELKNGKPHISRPRPLNGTTTYTRSLTRKRRARNPAYASSSLPPTSYLMPSSYYKLRGVQGVGGGALANLDQPDSLPQKQREVSFSDTFNQRVVGSRFQEVNRDSVAYGRLPLGSHVQVGESGELTPRTSNYPSVLPPVIPNYMQHGPNRTWAPPSDAYHSVYDSFFQRSLARSAVSSDLGEDWVDLLHEAPQTFDDEPDRYVEPETHQRPPRTTAAPPSDHRETFPLRLRNEEDSQSANIVPPHLRLQPQQPFVRPLSGMDHQDLGAVYTDISHWRTRLKAINAEISDAQRDCYNDIADGARVKGWLMVGNGLRFLPGIELIEGRSKEDIRWDELQREGRIWNAIPFWSMVTMLFVLLAAGLTAVSGLMLTTSPDVARLLTFLESFANTNNLSSGLLTVFCSTLAALLFITTVVMTIHHIAKFGGRVSISGSRLMTFKTTFFLLAIIAGIWFMVIGAVIFAVETFQLHGNGRKAVADGFIIMTAMALSLILSIAIISPVLLMLQPFRLWRVIRAEQLAVTPRQRFRATYPRTHDPSYALACCILGMVFASSFALIFPLIAPAATLLLFFTLISHRYLIGYVYGRTQSPTGGLLQIWLLRRLATLLALQPLFFGLIFLTRSLWEEAGVLLATSVFVIIFVESFCSLRTRQPGAESLSDVTQNALFAFTAMSRPAQRRNVDSESLSLLSSRSRRIRGSMASVLEMMSLTLGVMPSPSQRRGPVPLQTETLDDLTATERAARTHPDAPPHIPPLSFTDHAEDMADILYAPELIAPSPIIWLPNDAAGIAKSEAFDLQQYHALQVTLDVRTREDVLPRRSVSFGGRGTSRYRR